MANRHRRRRSFAAPVQYPLQTARKAPDREPPPDLLILRGEKIQGANPRFQDHEPSYSTIVDVAGNRPQIIECRIVRLVANSAGLGIEEQRNVYTPLPVPELWQFKPEHVILTHALRILQSSTYHQIHDGGTPELRKLRNGFSPLRLLVGTGLAQNQAEESLARLKSLELLFLRVNRSGECWFVNTNYRGIGPRLQKYTSAELIDGWALPDAEAGTDERVDPEEAVSGGPRKLPPYLKKNRHQNLTQALQALSGLVPVGSSPDEEGYFVFTIDGVPAEIVARQLGITPSQAAGLLADLDRLKVYRSVNIGGGRYLRKLRAGANEITEADLARVRVKKSSGDMAAKSRLSFVYPAYLILAEQVPDGVQPDELGFVEFETTLSFAKLIKERIPDLSEGQAERLVNDFHHAGVLHTENVSSDGQFRQRRRLKMGIKRFTDEDLDRMRRPYRLVAPPMPPSGATDVPEVELDEIEKWVVKATERIDQLSSEVARLEVEVAQRDEQIQQQEREIARLKAQAAPPRALPTKVIDELRARLSG